MNASHPLVAAFSTQLKLVTVLLLQAYEEVRFLCNANPDDNNLWVDLGTLPVIFQLENDPSFLSKSQSEVNILFCWHSNIIGCDY